MADKEIYTVSPSGVDTFLGCPRKYHYKYTAGITEPDNKEKTSLQWLNLNEKGTMIHRAMELYVLDTICPLSAQLGTSEVPMGSVQEKKIEDALDKISFDDAKFEKVWGEAVEEMCLELRKRSIELLEVPVTAKEKELAENKQDCKDALIYLIQQMKLNRQYPVLVEKKFGRRRGEETEPLVIQKAGEEDFAICGSIDRVDYDIKSGKYVVIDYKTGNPDKKRKLRKDGRDDLLQDRLYTLAFETLYPDKEVIASRYIFTSADNQEIYEDKTPGSKAKFIERLWEEVNAIRSKADVTCKNNETKYPDCEETCSYCGYADLCEAHDELLIGTGV